MTQPIPSINLNASQLFKSSIKRSSIDLDALYTEIWSLTRCHPDMVEASTLGVLSLALQNLLLVEKPSMGTSPVSLFTMNVADSGEGKSTLLRALMVPFREAEAESEKDYNTRALFNFVVEKKIWLKKYREIDKRISAAIKNNVDLSDLRIELFNIEGSKPTPPIKRRWIHSKSTPTALLEAFSDGNDSIGLIDPDASGILLGKTFSDLSLLNVLWDGDSLDLDRSGKDPIRLNNANLSICLGVQSAFFREFCEKSNSKARQIGFIARTILAVPPSRKGLKIAPDQVVYEYPEYEKYKDMLREILLKNREDESEKLVMKFEDRERHRWIEFEEEMNLRSIENTDTKFANEFTTRAADIAARIAALRSYFHTKSLCILGRDLTYAINFVRKQIDIHSVWVDQYVNELSAKEFSDSVDKFLLRKSQDGTLPTPTETRWLYSNYSDHGKRGKKYLEPHIDRLLRDGYITLLNGSKSKFVLNPYFFKKMNVLMTQVYWDELQKLFRANQIPYIQPSY